MLTETAQRLAIGLFDTGAIKFGEFKLKLHEQYPDAPLSPIYIDLRVVRSVPDLLDATVEMYEELVRGLNFDVYAEVPTAVTPIVSVLAYKTRVPMVTPRSKRKTHGVVRKIEGLYKRGQVALVIDDLITQADSKLETIQILKENGLVVKEIVVLLDREQGGKERLEKEGYTLHSAFKLTELLDFYLQAGKISKELFNKTVTYLKTAPSP